MEMAKSSSMGNTAKQKWKEAGFEVMESRFWKRGRTTVALCFKLSETAILPDEHERVIAKLARSQRLIAFGRDLNRVDGRQYHLFRKDELDEMRKGLHLAHQEILHTVAYLKQEAPTANVEAMMKNILVELDLALSEASVGHIQNAGERFNRILHTIRDGGSLLQIVYPKYQPTFLRLLKDFESMW